MKKEEILEASRKENKKKDLAVVDGERKAGLLAAISILILATVYYILGIATTGKTNYGWYSIIALYCTIFYGYKGIKFKNKFEIFVAIVWLLGTILTVYSYISDMINSSTII